MEPPDHASKLTFWETTGSVLWFAMDAGWMLEIRLAALVLILPTLASNLMALRYVPVLREKLVVWAMNSWLAMNIAWMAGDIFEVESYQMVAKAFTILGFTLLLILAFTSPPGGGPWYERLRRFRRLRVGSSR
jgi:hypothetical protein